MNLSQSLQGSATGCGDLVSPRSDTKRGQSNAQRHRGTLKRAQIAHKATGHAMPTQPPHRDTKTLLRATQAPKRPRGGRSATARTRPDTLRTITCSHQTGASAEFRTGFRDRRRPFRETLQRSPLAYARVARYAWKLKTASLTARETPRGFVTRQRSPSVNGIRERSTVPRVSGQAFG